MMGLTMSKPGFEYTIAAKREVGEIINSALPAEEVFPLRGWTFENYHRTLDMFCKGFSSVRDFHNRVKMMLGRLLVIAYEQPSLYKEAGHQNYEQFLLDLQQRFGICRAEMYDCRKIAAIFPELRPQEYADIGVSKLKVASRVLTPSSSQKEKDRVLELVRAGSYKEAVASVEATYSLDAGHHEMEVITIITAGSVKKQWLEFIARPEVHSYFGSDKPGGILAAMMETVASEVAEAGTAMERAACQPIDTFQPPMNSGECHPKD